MRARTFLLIALLISQPVSALSGVWQSGMHGQIDPAMTSHCESNTPTAVQAESDHSDHSPAIKHPASPESMSEHEDCTASCNMCASCAASVAAEHETVSVMMAAPPVTVPLLVLPSGSPELLYRPPIIS
jgi:hypothetical protein